MIGIDGALEAVCQRRRCFFLHSTQFENCLVVKSVSMESTQHSIYVALPSPRINLYTSESVIGGRNMWTGWFIGPLCHCPCDDVTQQWLCVEDNEVPDMLISTRKPVGNGFGPVVMKQGQLQATSFVYLCLLNNGASVSVEKVFTAQWVERKRTHH